MGIYWYAYSHTQTHGVADFHSKTGTSKTEATPTCTITSTLTGTPVIVTVTEPVVVKVINTAPPTSTRSLIITDFVTAASTITSTEPATADIMTVTTTVTETP